MTKNISSKQMYFLISKAVSESHNFKDMDVSVGIKAFSKKHWEYVKTSPQLSFLDEEIPTSKEVHEAIDFCELLDEYRRSVDVYVDEPEQLSESKQREILQGLDKYRPYILEEHKSTFNVLVKNLKRDLPEYRGEILLEELNEDAVNVYKRKQEASNTKDKAKREYKKEYCSRLAVEFFKTFKENSEIVKQTPDSKKKLTLYSNTLKIIDCLPDKKYSRSDKYRLKYKINSAIIKVCTSLGDNYYLAKENAKRELEKYEKAIYNAKRFLEQQDSEKGRSARARRDRDEWNYR